MNPFFAVIAGGAAIATLATQVQGPLPASSFDVIAEAAQAQEVCRDHTERLRGYVIKGSRGNVERVGGNWRVLVRYFGTTSDGPVRRATAECVVSPSGELVSLRKVAQ